jgi:hypothetical protein
VSTLIDTEYEFGDRLVICGDLATEDYAGHHGFALGTEVTVVDTFLDEGYNVEDSLGNRWIVHSDDLMPLAEYQAEEALSRLRAMLTESAPATQQAEADMVNHPPHYNDHPSGVECIQITEHMNFCLGNAVKYIWRADLKHDAIEDLEKAVWYVQREIARRKG